jgi:hypothetical protein
MRPEIRERIAAIVGEDCAGDYENARRLWLAGRCPCCGTEADEPDVDGTEPELIGEGVLMCGRCIRNRHMDYPPGSGEALLLAVLPG